MNKTLLAQFNSPDTVAVLSSFPDKNGECLSAIDRYTEQKFTDMSRDRKVIVCAEKRNSNEPILNEYKKNFLVAHTWEKGNVLSLLSLARFIFSLNKVKTVFVEFEFNVYGGTIPNFALLLILLAFKLSGKRVIFELHQVITNISKLEDHLNIHNHLVQKVLSLGIAFFYALLGLATNEIIVLEAELKQRLSKMVNPEHIHVLPHHMHIQKTIDIKKAKEKAGLPSDSFVVIVFGYLNEYKGVDWIAKAAKQWKNKKIHLLIAGGPNPYHKDKEYYKAYFQDFLATIKGQSNITYTGFVDEKDIGLYFSAADLALLPYRVFMAASGPFSLALSYGKPVVLSTALNDYSESEDFMEAMRTAKLRKKDLSFPLNEKKVLNMIEKIQGNTLYYKKLELFSQTLAQKRSGPAVNAHLNEILFPQALLSPRKLIKPTYPLVHTLQ